MLNSTTLNTRLLPLSILISSLVSGGAIAAGTEKSISDKLQDFKTSNVIDARQQQQLQERMKEKVQKQQLEEIAKAEVKIVEQKFKTAAEEAARQNDLWTPIKVDLQVAEANRKAANDALDEANKKKDTALKGAGLSLTSTAQNEIDNNLYDKKDELNNKKQTVIDNDKHLKDTTNQLIAKSDERTKIDENIYKIDLDINHNQTNWDSQSFTKKDRKDYTPDEVLIDKEHSDKYQLLDHQKTEQNKNKKDVLKEIKRIELKIESIHKAIAEDKIKLEQARDDFTIATKAKEAFDFALITEKNALDAQTAFDTAEINNDTAKQLFDAAEQAKSEAKKKVKDQEIALQNAEKAVVELNRVNPTPIAPVIDQTLDKTIIQTVAGSSLAVLTHVAGGTQNVQKDGKIISSMVREGGTVNLDAGAAAFSTTITDGTLNNQGGTDTDSVVQAGGKLSLTGSGVSHNALVTKGGSVTVSDDSAVNDMTSAGNITANGKATLTNTIIADGSLTLADSAVAHSTLLRKGMFIVQAGAKAIATEINGGTFTLEDGASAENTLLQKGSFTLNKGATATNTKVNGGKFRLGNGATTDGTIINGGEFDVQTDAIASNTKLNSGTFILSDGTAKDTTVNSGEFEVTNGATADGITLKGGKFSLRSRMQAFRLVVESGDALIASSLQDAIISGTINAESNSFIRVYEQASTQDANLKLAGKMEFIAANNSIPTRRAFKSMEMNGGTVDMSKSTVQLNTTSLTGTGTFNLGSKFINHTSAPLNVNGQADGQFMVAINDSGISPNNLDVAKINSGNADFTLANGTVNLGNYKYKLQSDGKGGFKLVTDTNGRNAGGNAALTPSTAGILALANTTPVIFNAELSSIHHRLDQQSTTANESGVWGTYLNDNYKVKGTATNFDQKLNGMTFGADKATKLDNGILSIGGFTSYSSSNIKSDYQSSGKVDSFSIGMYSQYLADDGYYVNAVLKANRFNQNVNISTQSSQATGSSKLNGLGLAVKAGKHINFDAFYVSPHIALSGFSSGKSLDTLSNGMTAENQRATAVTGTIGVNGGYRYVLNSGTEIKPYAILSVDNDLMASNKVSVNNEIFDNSLKGTRANAGVGINVNLNTNLAISTEVKLSKGQNVETPMTINMGVAYNF
ncbi:TPA: autotransporter outer membrane beta-barrel domain-containing protein [Yersinia enterocolitica]|uniref:autotransporter outer membrane beta-barrel domain-containing protein n=1 Tax=Yersinia enterocolitica TaxID=630 RepID=UPI0037063760